MTTLVRFVVLATLVALVACEGEQPTPTSVPPTSTPTSVPPTSTPTSIPPTPTPTNVPPTSTPTSIPPTSTPTSIPPTSTLTSIPPTPTPTNVPPTPTAEGGEQLTVTEYEAVCGSLIATLVGFEATNDVDEVLAFLLTLEMRVADLGTVNPPDELERFHKALLGSVEFAVNAFREIGLVDLVQASADLERDAANLSESEQLERALKLLEQVRQLELEAERLDAAAQEYGAEIEAAQSELSPTTHASLQAAGCFDQEGIL